MFSKDRWQNLRYGLHWRWSSCDVEFDVKPHRKAERAHLAKDVLCVTKLFSIRACSEGSFDVPAYCRSVVYGILDTVPRIFAPPHLNGRIFVQSRGISLDVAIPLSLDSGPGHSVSPSESEPGLTSCSCGLVLFRFCQLLCEVLALLWKVSS